MCGLCWPHYTKSTIHEKKRKRATSEKRKKTTKATSEEKHKAAIISMFNESTHSISRNFINSATKSIMRKEWSHETVMKVLVEMVDSGELERTADMYKLLR